jgi:hypothetical protein
MLYHGRLIEMMFNKKFVNETTGFCFMLTTNDRQYADSAALEPWTRFKQNGYRFLFDTSVSRLLKSPYTTNCRNYSERGVVSRGQCHDLCLRNKTLSSMLGKVGQYVTIFPHDTVSMVPVGQAYMNETVQNITQQLDDECANVCRQKDCETVIHTPQLLANMDHYSSTYVRLSSSPKPLIRIVSKPSISLVTFLTGLFSTSGFWLGVSVLDFLLFLEKLQTFCSSKSNRKRSAKNGWVMEMK